MRKFILFSCSLLFTCFIKAQVISTIAGGIIGNGVSDTSMGCAFWGVVPDNHGNIYVTDQANYAIRKINLSSGIMNIYAGNGSDGNDGDGGPATNAELYSPTCIARDTNGNIYYSDPYMHVVRMVNGKTNIISTVAGNGTLGSSGDGGPATAAELNYPLGIAVDDSGNLFIADDFNSNIRKVYAATGIIATIAGSGFGLESGDGGPATAAVLDGPEGICVDKSGNFYISDANGNRIRKVTAATGIISLFAGSATSGGYAGDGGPATNALLNFPEGLAIDTSENLYIVDGGNNRIRIVNGKTGVITTIAGNGTKGYSGNGGPATAAEFNYPYALSVDDSGNVFMVDLNNDLIRKIQATNKNIYKIAGNRTPGFNGDGIAATNAQIYAPSGLTLDGSGNLYIADWGNSRIREINPSGIITTFAGGGSGGDNILAKNSGIPLPNDVKFDQYHNMFIPEVYNGIIRKVDANDTITRLAGTGFYGYSGDGGPATAAEFEDPYAVGIDTSGNVYIADQDNNRIRMVNRVTGDITTVAGNGTYGYSGDGGSATAAKLYFPEAVAFDNANNMFIADTRNNCIRKVDAKTGIISTIAGKVTGGFSGDGGPATAAELEWPSGVTIDQYGRLFIADQNNNRIRMVILATDTIYTVAGNGTQGYSGDGGPALSAALDQPENVALDAWGNLYIADMGNNRVRKVSAPLGIQELSNKVELIIYPNPSNGIFNLSIKNYQLGEECNAQVYDVLGRQVYSESFDNKNLTIKIDLSDEPSGIYFCRVISETGNLIGEGRLIIQ